MRIIASLTREDGMPEIRRFQTRGIDVRGMEAGQGQTLLFLHGASGLPPWNAFFEALSARYAVKVLEHPGFGASDLPPTIRNVADVAMYYLDVLDALDASGVHLVGHSLGGWLAAELATRNCARLASVSLLAPAGIRIKGMPIGDNFIWSQEESARNLFHDQSFAERMLAHTPSDEEAGLAMRSRFMAAQLGWEPRWFNPALERWLHRISVPSFVVWGRDDKLLPPAYADVWRREIPRCEGELIGDCGHLPHVEKAEQTAACLLNFLAGI